MKRTVKTLLCLLLTFALLISVALPVFAADAVFGDGAYMSVLTASDFQDLGSKAYERFGRMLGKMKDDGLETPDSMLVGGDYTKILFDYAAPGVTQIRQQLTAVYPDADPDAVVCIQGNHDNPTASLTKTGFYDMGGYCLYVINEDDFPWQQGLRPLAEKRIKALADKMTAAFDGMIENGDLRPVIVLTHLPLHHTTRNSYADNKYASYLFNAINAAAETLDVIFLFGHQHSGDFDDYIGGSVNFFAPGETLRVPLTDKAGENAYAEETLNFTYANCGYVGYSDNTENETSTNKLTLGVIRFTDDSFRFVKYTEDGFYAEWTVARKNPGTGKDTARTSYPALTDAAVWKAELDFFTRLFAFFRKLIALFSFAA